jgi:hypothetical protein
VPLSIDGHRKDTVESAAVLASAEQMAAFSTVLSNTVSAFTTLIDPDDWNAACFSEKKQFRGNK